jgi:PKD repeat protein
MIAVGLVIALQFATITIPPDPANANSTNDVIHGGFVSRDDLLNRYDSSAELQTLYHSLGINREDVVDAKTKTISSKDHSLHSLGRNQHAADDALVSIPNHDYYGRPLYALDADTNVSAGSTYRVLEGSRSTDHGYFAVMYSCGNLIYKTLPPKPTPPAPAKPSLTPSPSRSPTPVPATPKPTHTPKPSPSPAASLTCTKLTANLANGSAPLAVTFSGQGAAVGQTISQYNFNFGDQQSKSSADASSTHTYTKPGTYVASLSLSSATGIISPDTPNCHSSVVVIAPPAAFSKTKSAQNLTQNRDATLKPAAAGDQIRYVLTTKNTGGLASDYTVVEHLEDVMEYASLSDSGGGSFDHGVLTWPTTALAPGADIAKSFTVTIKNPIPETPVGVSDRFSYDLRLDNVYGALVSVAVAPPLAKQVESASTNLPATGAATSTLIILVVCFLALYFYLRNRQLMHEIHILRGNYQGGLPHVS